MLVFVCAQIVIFMLIFGIGIYKNSCASQDNQKLIVSGESLGKRMHGFIDKLTGFLSYALSVMLV